MYVFSASQVTSFRECERKWAWRSIAKIDAPPHPAALLGIEVDEGQLQPYLRDGVPLDESRLSGQIAKHALEHLPEPKTPGMVLQKAFEFEQPKLGFGYLGYMDLWAPDSSIMPGAQGGAPLVCDFKTTGNVGRRQKGPKQLAVDVQAMLYATHTMFQTGAREVDLAWVYMQTKGERKTKPTHLRVVAQQAVDQLGCINGTAKTMAVIRDSLKDVNPDIAPLELKPNYDMCDKYGGCPYQFKCNHSPLVFTDVLEETAMNNAGGLMAQLAALRAQALGQAQAPAAGPGLAKAGYPAAWDEVQAEGINPPEKDLPLPPPVEAAPAEVSKKRGRPPTKKDPLGADVAAAIATPVVVSQATEVENKVEAEIFIKVPMSALQRVLDALKGAA